MQYVRKLISASKIQRKVKKLGKQITKDYAGKEPVVICMLKGAVYFFSDLTKSIKLPIMIDFARLSSYRNGTTSGKMELIAKDEKLSKVFTKESNKIIEKISCESIGKQWVNFLRELVQKQPIS